MLTDTKIKSLKPGYKSYKVSKWCDEMRAHVRAMKVGPTSVQESEQMMETAIRLAEESAGISKQGRSRPSICLTEFC